MFAFSITNLIKINMRCNNCGWDNPEGQVKCAKCNNVITDKTPPQTTSKEVKKEQSEIAGTIKGGKADEPALDKQNLQGTIKGGHSEASAWDKSETAPVAKETKAENVVTNCSNCGYPVSHGADKCPKCGTKMNYSFKDEEIKKTINPYSRTKNTICYLSLLPRENEKDIKNIELEGDSIDLTRSNTEPENESLSRGIHAKLVQRNGNWYLSNPEDKVTFIKVAKEIKLEPGDVFLLGDRMIRFEK